MKNSRSFLVCLLGLSLTALANSYPMVDVEASDSATRDYYIQQAEAKRYRLELREDIRSIFIQSTLNCLKDFMNENSQERHDIVLDKCFKVGMVAAKYSDDSSITHSFNKPIDQLRSTIKIEDTRIFGRQDLMQTLLCVASGTNSLWREYSNPKDSIKEKTDDKRVLEKCGFDPVLMGTRKLPLRSEDQGGNGLLNLERNSN